MKHTRSSGAPLHLLASLPVLVALSSCEQGCASNEGSRSRPLPTADAATADAAAEPDATSEPSSVDAAIDRPRAPSLPDFQWVNPRPQGNHLLGVWRWGDETWAVGRAGTILHSSGLSFSLQRSGTEEDLHAIWGSGLEDIWAVGTNCTILHNTGSGWSRVPSNVEREGRPCLSTFGAIWGSGPDDVWVVATEGSEVIHWNGSSWSRRMEGLQRFGGFSAIWGQTASDVWIVGTYGGTAHWDCGQVSVLRRPSS